jgi:FkbM family methyltransferase
MQNILKNDSYMGLIDIGTNIGVFSLTAAAMGHNVLSIEPWLENYRRFHKSVKLGHLEKRITLITNSLLNKRGSYSLVLSSNNQGNIRLKDATAEKQTNATKNRLSSKSVTMNDLVPLCKFKKAFMKMDIEGNEHKALAAADRLFDAIDISYIMMEWTFLNDYLLQSKPKEDFLYAKQMLRFLEERDYVPETLRHAPLNIYNMNKWPNLIVWRKKTAI